MEVIRQKRKHRCRRHVVVLLMTGVSVTCLHDTGRSDTPYASSRSSEIGNSPATRTMTLGNPILTLPKDTGHADIDARRADRIQQNTTTSSEHGKAQDISVESESARKIIDGLKFCASSHDKETRISCYDDVSKSYGIAVADTDGRSVEAGTWSVKNDERAGDYIAMLQSGTGVSIDGVEGHVDLYVRCRNKQMSIYMKNGSNIGEADVMVSLGMDALNNGRSYQFHPSKTGDAFGIWNSQQAHVLYDFLSGLGSTLPASFIIDGHAYRFNANLSRMREDTAQVRMACYVRDQ